jgi:protein TIF31
VRTHVHTFAEPYTLREARIHLRHVRDLLRSLDPSDAYNGVDGASLSYAATVASHANALINSTTLVPASQPSTTAAPVGTANTGRNQSGGDGGAAGRARAAATANGLAERASMDCTPPDYALPSARERPLACLHPINKDLVTANVACVKYLAPSGWNPPPGNRKLKGACASHVVPLCVWCAGDIMYLVTHTLEGRRYHITCCTRGWYVNQSTSDEFSPKPANGKAASVYHSLIELLNHVCSRVCTCA